MASLSVIMVGGIPRGVTRTHLMDHFGSSSYGGGTIEYMLHPLGNDLSMAVIKFVDDKVAALVMQKTHTLCGVQLQTALLPRQVLAQCQADVDPLILAGLPDIVACMDLLRSDFGVKVSYDSLVQKMSLQGSFLQIQFAQSALNSVYQKHEEMRLKKLKQATEGVIDLPLRSVEGSLHKSRELFSGTRTYSPLSFKSDHFSEPESPARTLHVEDLRAALPVKHNASHTSQKSGTISPSGSARSEKSLQEVLMEQLSQSMMSSNGIPAAMSTRKSEDGEEVAAIASLEQSGFMRNASDVDNLFASTLPTMSTGPQPSESIKEEDLLMTGESEMITGTLGKSDQRVVVEFDTPLFDYMRRIHGQSLKDLEHSYQVQLQYKKNGNLTMVRILPASPESTSIAPQQVRQPLINLYQTMVQAVSIHDIKLQSALQKDHALVNQVIKKVKEEYRNSVFVDTKDKTKLTLTGEDAQVQSAEMYIRNTLDLRADGSSVRASKEVETARSLELEKVRQSQSPRSNPRPSIKSPREFGKRHGESVKSPQEPVKNPRESTESPRHLNSNAENSKDSPRDLLKSSRSSIHSPRNSSLSPRQSVRDSQMSLSESTEAKLASASASFTSLLQSPRETNRDLVDGKTGSTIVPLVVKGDSVEVNAAPVRSDSPRAAWPSPEHQVTSSQSLQLKPGESVQMSVQTSMTGVTPLSSQNLSTGDLSGLSYITTGQSLEPCKSVEFNLSQPSAASESNHLSRVSFVSTGELDVSAQQKEPETFKFVTKEGIKVSVFKGDIASSDANAIVCPAPEDLRLLRGVAVKISQAAGFQLQEKCTEHVVKHGPLKVSEVFTAPATGMLASKHVICAVGPMWCLWPDKLVCETVLKQTFINCLLSASTSLEVETIAIPPISTGDMGVPADVCAWAMLAAIEEFSSTSSNNSIKEIQIVNEDTSIGKIIGQTLQEVLVERESAQPTPIVSPRTLDSSYTIIPVPFIARLTAACVKIAERAGAIIQDIMRKGELGIVQKGFKDLQTEADRSAEKCIVASLKAQFPGIITVGEESGKDTEIDVQEDWIEMGQSEDVLEACHDLNTNLCEISVDDVVVWVDPLDGTSEYTQGLLDHVTTLIGIGVKGQATAGVIHQPFFNYKAEPSVPRGRSMWGIVGVGAFGFQHQDPPQGNVIVTTRSHGTGAVAEAVDACGPTDVIRVGGCGHKVALILEGKANAYVFASPGCKKWDTAAPEAILHAIGGTLTDIHGNQLEYHEDIQRRNSAGVLATPAGACHEWYIDRVPKSVKEALPPVMDTKSLDDPMHKLNPSQKAPEHPFIAKLTAACVKIAERAGVIIQDIMRRGELGIVQKDIKDLQTEADRSAEKCIVASLKAQFPGIVTVGEESGKDTEIDVQEDWIEMGQSEGVLEACKNLNTDLCQISVQDVVVWVDPLDGTSEYTQGLLDHVTSLIGIGVKGQATAGVIHQPFFNYKAEPSVPRGRSMWGIVGVGAFGFQHQDPPQGNVIVTTRSHGTGAVAEAVDACGPTDVIRVGGCGHKVALILEGKANAYVFASPGCKKWDTAAPEAILHAIGGTLTDIHGNQLKYHEDIQRRNSAGVLATPAGACHEWYVNKIPMSVREALPAVMDTNRLEDPMHKLTATQQEEHEVHTDYPFIVKLMAACVSIAEKAGAIIREVTERGELCVVDKGVNDPQTEADRSAEKCIIASLKAQFPDIVTVGEESGTDTDVNVQSDWIEMKKSEDVLKACKDVTDELSKITIDDVVVWVDPLDGTADFAKGLLDHVTTLIGIAVRGHALAGVVHRPFYNRDAAAFVPRGRSLWGIIGVGAFGHEQHTLPEGNVLVVSAYRPPPCEAAIQACEPTEVIQVGGCGNKCSLVLEGKAHAFLLPANGCMKWDTAAPEAVIRAAGGLLIDIHGNRYQYHKDVQLNNSSGILATAVGVDPEWYLQRIPESIKESAPVVLPTKESKSAPPLRTDRPLDSKQPEDGIMSYEVDRKIQLLGFAGTPTIVIQYVFPSGMQKEVHPRPGMPYEGGTLTAYLPNTTEGRQALHLLREAFELGMTFTVEHSWLRGDNLGKVTWADIPHKTSVDGGPEGNGYPDYGYIDQLCTLLTDRGLRVKSPRQDND